MMLFFNLVIIITTSVLINLILDIKRYVSGLLSIYLFSFSNIVMVCSVAGFANQLDNPFFFTIIHCLILLLVLGIGIKKKKIDLKNVFQRPQFYKNFLYKNYSLTLFFVVILLSLGFQAVLIYIMPPNTFDSLTTHLSRIGYWLENKTFLPFPVHNIRDIYYPMNPAFQVLWTIVLNGNDTLVEISQFIAMLICAVSVYGLSRIFDRSKRSALLNAMLFLSYPIVLMQGTTTQTDLMVAALIACAFYFLFVGFKKGEFKYLSLSSLAVVLALGSKQTAFFILPGYLLTFILLWLKKRKALPKLLLRFFLISLLFVLFFASLTYIDNLVYFKGFFGLPGAVEGEMQIKTLHDAFDILKYNCLRLTYDAIDPLGLVSPIKNYFIKFKALIFTNLGNIVHLDLEANKWVGTGHTFDFLYVPHLTEDEAWYGPVGFFMILTALITGIYRAFKKKDTQSLGLVLTFVIYAFCIILFRPGWDPFQGRYFLSLVVLITPLIDLYFSKKKAVIFLRSAIIITAISVIITTHLFNEGKPAVVSEKNSPLNRETIWNLDQLDRMTIQNRTLREPLRTIDLQVPRDATIGLCIDTGTWDYPFFRSDFSQRIISITPKDLLLDKNWLLENKIDFVVLRLTNTVLFQNPPDFLTLIYEHENWMLFQVNN